MKVTGGGLLVKGNFKGEGSLLLGKCQIKNKSGLSEERLYSRRQMQDQEGVTAVRRASGSQRSDRKDFFV